MQDYLSPTTCGLAQHTHYDTRIHVFNVHRIYELKSNITEQ